MNGKTENVYGIPYKEGEVIIYTDGGARGNGASDAVCGYGFCMTYGADYYMEGHGATIGSTNNKMELYAIIAALSAVEQTNAKVTVYTDSNLIYQGWNNWLPGWIAKGWRTTTGPVKNVELWKMLRMVARDFKDLRICKCKGHAGDPGNERADALVNEAMDLCVATGRPTMHFAY